MKRLICIVSSLLLTLALVSCDIGIDVESFDLEDDTSKSSTAQSDSDNEKQPRPNESESTEDSSNQNNNVLKNVASETMKVPVNMKHLGTMESTGENNSKIKVTGVLYSLDGNVVNWTTENDFIYVITSGNNRLVIIDSKKMKPIYNAPLAGVPAEMNIIGDKIYISLPDLCRIDVFSKSTCEKENSIYFSGHSVSSFCLDGDYIYYSEHDQHCKVFKKNLVTGDWITLQFKGNSTFYCPKLCLNKEDGILYVGESESSGSAIYYFDAYTFALKSVFEHDNYGIMNHTREIFHIGDKIFWGNYCLSDTNAQELIGRYGTASYGSVVYASEEIVATYEGIFLTDTCECFINYYDADFDYEYVLVSESGNVFFRERSWDCKTIIGVNFELQ